MHMLRLESSKGIVNFPIYTDDEVIVSKIERRPGECDLLHDIVIFSIINILYRKQMKTWTQTRTS